VKNRRAQMRDVKDSVKKPQKVCKHYVEDIAILGGWACG
jgi:hypothetical protein